MSADTLFDIPREWIAQHSRDRAEAAEAQRWRPTADLDAIAFCYTGTERGNCSGIRFAMSVDDARAWCSSDVSRGVLHGTRWSYFWTTAARFLSCFPPPLDLRGYVDNGEWDDRISGLGLRKIGFGEIGSMLAPYGVDVLTGES